MDTLPEDLAQEARRLGLSACTSPTPAPEQLQEFALLVLQELAARGLVEGEERVGCWAAPRRSEH